MSSRSVFASVVIGCVITVGLVGLAVNNAASAGQSVPKPGKSGNNSVIEIKHRGRGPLFYLPIAPSRLAYDYPYYYSRGHYPKHIGPGYIYYGYRLSTTAGAPIGTGYASPIFPRRKR